MKLQTLTSILLWALCPSTFAAGPHGAESPKTTENPEAIKQSSENLRKDVCTYLTNAKQAVLQGLQEQACNPQTSKSAMNMHVLAMGLFNGSMRMAGSPSQAKLHAFGVQANKSFSEMADAQLKSPSLFNLKEVTPATTWVPALPAIEEAQATAERARADVCSQLKRLATSADLKTLACNPKTSQSARAMRDLTVKLFETAQTATGANQASLHECAVAANGPSSLLARVEFNIPFGASP